MSGGSWQSKADHLIIVGRERERETTQGCNISFKDKPQVASLPSMRYHLLKVLLTPIVPHGY
jgi:hypothetical protein